MGCGASKEDYISPIHVPDAESGYPPPKPPRDRKLHVFKSGDCAAIEANAKRAPKTVVSSYSAIISYVTKDTRTDVERVRAIYAWMAAQPIFTMKFSKVKDAHSPDGYMKTIQQGDGSYTAFFALLCRAANIPCVIIHGLGKAANYEVGDQDLRDLKSAWTAVHVDGSWRLVHIFWALVGVEPPNSRQRSSVVANGHIGTRQTERSKQGKPVRKQDDFWFLTDPDQFIYFCRADKTEWQLLQSPWPMDKFVNVPFFSVNYFDSGFKLISEHAAILHSRKGKCDITFQHSETVDADLGYTLQLDEKRSKEKLPQSLKLEKYVIMCGTQTEKSLRVRFPVRGVYKMKVEGSAVHRTTLASFRLECDQVMLEVHPYPVSPEIGYGYNKVAEDVGLSKPSQVKGVVIARPGETIKFQFRCKARLELQASLVHKDKSEKDLADYVMLDRYGDDVTIAVTIPEQVQNPEYALQVGARQENSGGDYDNVVNYLLTHGRDESDGSWTNRSRRDSDEYNTSDEDKLRERLIAATDKRDIKQLEKAILNCERAKMLDNGDLTRARRVLISLHEQALQAAIKERELTALDAALEAANESCVAAELHKGSTMEEAESLRSLLRRLNLYLHKILELQPKTVSEIHSYKRPRPLIHTVMKATYLLLGEKEQQLQRWEYIQTLLRRQGRYGIIRRIRDFDLVHLKVSSLNRADTHLKYCNKEVVRQASAGAGTFYVWSSNMIKEKKKLDKGSENGT